MLARPADAAEEGRWDELVVATGRPHILQSRAWADLKALTGWGVRRFVFDGGVAQVLTKRLPLGITVAYAPRGPLVEPAGLTAAILALRDALAKERCASLLCDPELAPDEALRAELERSGVRRSPVFVQPRRTLLMDLTLDPGAMQAAMRKKTRQYINKGEREGVVTEETRDLDRFLRVLRAVGERDKFALHSREYFERLLGAFGDRAHMMIARVGDEDAGALMLARMSDRAWELYGGWSGAHAESRPFYLLKWRAMMRMRALGARRYDMWGLAEGADDPLAGVENFKLGFGGQVTEWIGALETPVRPMLYPVWQLAARRRLARSAA
ncbi:MAG TPA: peptidoglycan bridge formation glycyltransferase FemA/FemB family protein [Candidatus Limnocylindria bacterium]|nr:peptidoglycan bridge formation glycyltransferase FemA/FemB family protein [Candidatus Limnocylindria bacterium]